MRENHRKNIRNLLLSQLPFIANFGTWYLIKAETILYYSNNLVSKLSNLKKARMLMKPLEMKAKLAEK